MLAIRWRIIVSYKSKMYLYFKGRNFCENIFLRFWRFQNFCNDENDDESDAEWDQETDDFERNIFDFLIDGE